MIKTYIGLHVKYPLFLSDLKELEFSRQNFEKYSNIKFHKKSFQREPSGCMRTDGRTDRHDEANSRFSQFANAPEYYTPDNNPFVWLLRISDPTKTTYR